jgi:archaellum component FlaG (FlaF/FlaG flagellin family)
MANPLPRSTKKSSADPRWQWWAAAAAVSLASVPAAHAQGIIVPLSNNYFILGSGNHLNADLTGDNTPDITISNVGSDNQVINNNFTDEGVHCLINGYILRAQHTRFFNSNDYLAQIGPGIVISTRRSAENTSSIPITFSDPAINNGTTTPGQLEVSVGIYEYALFGEFRDYGSYIQLDSYTYDPIPEPSTLALLALGAGGVLALRRRRLAA